MERSSKSVWAAWGIAFGGVFPVIAMGLRMGQYGYTETMALVVSDPLFWIIFTAPVFLGLFAYVGGRQNDKVREFSQKLELKVLDRTRSLNQALDDLSIQSKNQQSLLAGLSDGVFYFNKSGFIAQERSPELQRILPGSERCSTIEEFFETFVGTSADDVSLTLSCLFDDVFLSPFDDTVAFLGKETSLECEGRLKFVRFSYKAQMDDAGDLENVLVFVRDVTAKKEAEERRRIQSERIKRISMAAADTESFLQFRVEAGQIIKRIEKTFAEGNWRDGLSFMRDMHTLKGNTAIFEFSSLSRSIHELEGLVVESPPAGGGAVEKAWRRVKSLWQFETRDIDEVLGLQHLKNYRRVSIQKLSALERGISVTDRKALAEAVQGLSEYPIQAVFAKYKRLLKSTAGRSQKSVRIEFMDGSAELSYEQIAPMDGALVHIFRNCIAHGIEPSDKRESEGKPREGLIGIRCHKQNGQLHLLIKDDGKGVDTTALAKKAVSLGHWTLDEAKLASHTEKINLIFVPTLTTAAAVTETSGRGVGMDAVKASIESLGGHIEVYSEPGTGTQFEIKLPMESENVICIRDVA